MTAFADTHGEPDAETTARMRERLRDSLRAKEGRKRRVRHWLQASAVTAVVLGAVGFAAWNGGWLDGGADATVAGVIQTAEHPQRIERPWGEVELAARTLVRIDASDAGDAIELVDGELVVSADADAPIVVRIGTYEVRSPVADEPTGARRFSVRRTPGVPLVTVHEGRVRMSGPDLPAEGVVMSATAR
jgi:ferric-dicitrate binding protein FerR (iron transport regulator)